MVSEMNAFMNALMCFVVEFIVFGVIVTLFILASYRRAWKLNPPSHSGAAEQHSTM
jgi:hypothetical protein